LDKRVTRN